MAKKAKFSEEKLLDAVVAYARQHRGKIEAAKVAEWASKNIEGLEGVEGRHFTRPEQRKNPKTGNTEKITRLCTAKISELNAARNNISAVKSNVLLKSSNIDKFFCLPPNEQRSCIMDARAQVENLIAENAYLRAENKTIRANANHVSDRAEDLNQILTKLKKDHEKVLVLTSRIMDEFDEAERKKMLQTIGVCDGLFDLDTYVDSLTLRIDEAESINTIIRKDRATNGSASVNDLMKGIEFD